MAQRGCACHPARLCTGFVINASRTTKRAAHS